MAGARIAITLLALVLLAAQLFRLFVALRFVPSKVVESLALLEEGTEEEKAANRTARAEAWVVTPLMQMDQMVGYALPVLLLAYVAAIFAAVPGTHPFMLLLLALPAAALFPMNAYVTHYLPAQATMDAASMTTEAKQAVLERGEELFAKRLGEFGLHAVPLVLGWVFLMYQTSSSSTEPSASSSSTSTA